MSTIRFLEIRTSSAFADPESFPPLLCLACHGPLDLHRPAAATPARGLGTCPQ